MDKSVRTSTKSLSTKSKGNESQTILGKRKYGESFTEESLNVARYNQPIPQDFFQVNIGHCTFQEQSVSKSNQSVSVIKLNEDFGPFMRRERDCESKYDIDEMREWCEYYIANKNLFNV